MSSDWTAAKPANAETTARTGSRWRSAAVAVLVVLACVLAPFAGAAVWLNNQLTDTDRYIRTISPLAGDPAIQQQVATSVTTQLFTRVDIVAEARDALPPRAEFLAVPLAAGVRRAAEDATLGLLRNERFEQLWIQINRLAHEQLVSVLKGGGDTVQTADGQVVLDLAPVVAAVKSRLEERGITIFDRVPEGSVGTNFVLMDAPNLEKAQRGVRALDALALALPLIVVGALAAAVALSRNRRRTLLRASLGIAAAMLVLGLALTAARAVYVDAVAGPRLSEDAAVAFYDIVVRWLRYGIRAIFAIALLVALGAFLTGPSRAAASVRSRFGRAVSWTAGGTGLRTSAAGRWVGENKRALRIASIAVPVAIFFLWTTPTVAVLVVLVVLALLALLTVEVVGAEPAARS